MGFRAFSWAPDYLTTAGHNGKQIPFHYPFLVFFAIFVTYRFRATTHAQWGKVTPAPPTSRPRRVVAADSVECVNLPERIHTNNARLERIAGTNERLSHVADQLREGWETLAPLIAYYEDQWQADFAEFGDAQVGLFSEDGVWNEMGTFYHAVKEISEVAHAIVAEYEKES